MKKQNGYFLGIDVSKSWFDVSVMAIIDHERKDLETKQFDNNKQGLAKFKGWLKKLEVNFGSQTLVVIENTGIYHRLIWKFFNDNDIPIHIGNAAHIKKSFGIAREKNDKIDSQRLCSYAYKNQEELKASATLNPTLLELNDLMTSGKRFQRQLNANKSYLKELKNFNDKKTQKALEKTYKAAIEGLEKSLKETEKQMEQIINDDPDIKANYELLKTVPGIGEVIARYLIGCTNNFSSVKNGKELSCFAGVAPFGHSSGSSIKGRKRVHFMADKKLKALLYMGALATLSYYAEFRDYYQRKIAEGKHHNCVMNAIMNKILLRAVSVVNNQQQYVCNYKKVA